MMSSVTAKDVDHAVAADRAAEPDGAPLRVVASTPELYPSLADAIRTAMRNRHLVRGLRRSREHADMGRDTGARV